MPTTKHTMQFVEIYLVVKQVLVFNLFKQSSLCFFFQNIRTRVAPNRRILGLHTQKT